MLIYGEPGLGKTTFAATAPNPILADAEMGANFLGLRGFNIDIVRIKKWEDMQEFYKLIEKSQYKTVVLDPVNELLEKLIHSLKDESRLTTINNTLTLQGWGIAKERMKAMLKTFRDLEKNVIVIAHADEPRDEERYIRRPRIQANLAGDLEAMMDIVGYLSLAKEGKRTVRRLYLAPSDTFHAKDRTGTLPTCIDSPTFDKVYDYIIKNPVVLKQLEMEERMNKKKKNFEKDLK